MSGEISRRDFLKLTGAAVAGLVLPPIAGASDLPRVPDARPGIHPATETIMPSQDRFFEDIHAFDRKKIEVIKKDLFDFGVEFKEELKPIGFRREQWNSDVEILAGSISNVKEAYDAIKKEDQSPQTKEYFQNSFYELSSAAWAILRVKERYTNDKKGLGERIKKYFKMTDPGTVTEYTDLLLDDEIFQINAKWSLIGNVYNRYGNWFRTRIFSPTIELLMPPKGIKQPVDQKNNTIGSAEYIFDENKEHGLARVTTNYEYMFPPHLGRDNVKPLRIDPDVVTSTGFPRPMEPVFSGVELSADQKNKIISTLAKYGLNRAVNSITIFSLDTETGAWYSNDEREVGISKDIPNSTETVREDTLVHEVFHGLYYSIAKIKDPSKRAKLLIKLHQICRKISPYYNYGLMFDPYRSTEHNRIPKDASRWEHSKIMDEHELTQYSGKMYWSAAQVNPIRKEAKNSPDGIFEPRFHLPELSDYLANEIGYLVSPKRQEELTWQVLSVRPTQDDLEKGTFANKEYDTFREYFEAWKKERAKSNYNLTGIENEIIAEIEKHAEVIDNYRVTKERKFGYKWNWDFERIHSFALSKLIHDDPDGFISKVYNLNPQATPQMKEKVKHAVLVYANWCDFFAKRADVEQFAVIGSASLRYISDGVDTKWAQTTEGRFNIAKILDETGRELKDIILQVQEEGLAYNMSLKYQSV